MIPWTTQEIFLLVGLWPKASAAQISKLLNRSRSSICGKAKRLRRDDLLPASVEKHFEVKPARPGRAKPETTIRPERAVLSKPAPPPINDTLAMRPCALIELGDGQCRWPLGDMHQLTTLFCGGAAVPRFSYCGHHLRMARCDRGLSQSDRCDKRLLQPSH